MLLRQKITIAFLLTAIIPMLLIGLITYSHIAKTLEQAVLDSLRAVARSKTGELYQHLDKLETITRDFASDGFIRDSLRLLNNEPVDRQLSITLLNQHLKHNKQPLSRDLLYIDILNLDGVVIGSSDTARSGRNDSAEPYYHRGRLGIHINDVRRHAGELLTVELAAPIYSRTEPTRLLGVLVNHFSFAAINKLFTGHPLYRADTAPQSADRGQNVAIYLVNQQRQMISTSVAAQHDSLWQTIDSYPVQMCGEHRQEVTGRWKNHHDIKVVGASTCIEIDDFVWTLITEQTREQAFSRVTTLAHYYLAIGLIIFAATLVLALLLSNNITGPIKRLTAFIETYSSGRAGAQVTDITGDDEIGILARSFNNMSKDLHKAYTDIHTKNQQLQELSNRDGLTGLFNHRHLKELLAIEFNRSLRYHTPLSCLVIDIDYFKNINDTYGHLFGDLVLQGVAKIIHNLCRTSDIASRYGGEEFVVILPNTNLEQAGAVAHKLLTTIAGTEHTDSKNAISVTVSIGVTHVHDGADSYEQLLDEADQALYQAKRTGRNRVCLFTPTATGT